MQRFSLLLISAVLLTATAMPRATHAEGPMVILDIYNDSIELRRDSKQDFIEFDEAVKEIQAIRIKRDGVYYLVAMTSDGDTVRLHLFRAGGENSGKEIKNEIVFSEPDAADFTVLKLETKIIRDIRIFQIRGIKTNASGQPTTRVIARYKIKPTTNTPIRYQKTKKKSIQYPDLTGLSDADAGLAIYNYHRQSAGLFPIKRSGSLDHGCGLHAEYMRMNDELTHFEEPGLPGYTEEGDNSGGASNVTKQPDGSMVTSIEILMAAVYHRFSMIDNYAQSFGYGISGKSATGFRYGCFDIGSDSISNNDYGEENNVTYYDPANHAPIPHPGVNQAYIPTTVTTSEFPDPVEPFNGTYPFGYPVSLGMSALYSVTNVSMELRDPSGNLVSGYLRAPDDPTDPNLVYQGNNITYIPKSPLQSRTTYTAKVSATVGEEDFKKEWRFTTE